MTALQHNILIHYSGRPFKGWRLDGQEEHKAYRQAQDDLVASGHLHKQMWGKDGEHYFHVLTDKGREYVRSYL